MNSQAFIEIGSIRRVGKDQGVALEDLLDKVAEHKGCGSSGGDGKSSCGSSARPQDVSEEVWNKIKNHPCYSEEAHHHYARMQIGRAHV